MFQRDAGENAAACCFLNYLTDKSVHPETVKPQCYILCNKLTRSILQAHEADRILVKEAVKLFMCDALVLVTCLAPAFLTSCISQRLHKAKFTLNKQEVTPVGCSAAQYNSPAINTT